MYPELFEIPFTNLTIKSYGLMMVIGFLCAIYLIKRLSRNILPDSQMITNAALYSLIAGVVGARVFYVVHYWQNFKDDLLSAFAVWEGGLELLGGVICAVLVIIFYLRHQKLPVKKYLDILAIALMLALGFGRIGCFLNGCCFGKPTDLPLGVRFPYGSLSYKSQIYPDLTRDRPEPYLKLPADFSIYNRSVNGIWPGDLKPYEDLTAEQKNMVDNGRYRALPVHPTQLYSSAYAFAGCFLLYLFWKRNRKDSSKVFARPGCTFALMLIIYSLCRFSVEFLRDDNPFEFDSLTVSQNLAIGMIIVGGILMTIFQKAKPQ